jgi:hypothetical protein
MARGTGSTTKSAGAGLLAGRHPPILENADPIRFDEPRAVFSTPEMALDPLTSRPVML